MNHNDEMKEQSLEAGRGSDVVPTRSQTPKQITLTGEKIKKPKIQEIYDDGIGQVWARKNDNGMYSFFVEVDGKKEFEMTIPEAAKESVIRFLEEN